MSPVVERSGEGTDGYAWLERWACPFEGPFSVFMKFCDANCMSALDADRACFSYERKHRGPGVPRSFLDMRWPNFNKRSHVRGMQMQSMSLQANLPNIWSFLASDRAIRYCPSCVRYGYQSMLAQVDGLVRCPIHEDEHLVACQHCGRSTGPYVLTPGRRSNTWVCDGCQMPFGGQDRMQSICRWQTPPGVEALAPIYEWLRAVDALNPKWGDLPFWSVWGPVTDLDTARARRVAAFEVFASMLEPPASVRAQVGRTLDVRYWTVSSSVLTSTEELGTERTRAWEAKLYTTVLAELIRSGRPLAHSDVCQRARTCLVPVCKTANVHAHALTIWRCQFERFPDAEGSLPTDGTLPVLRPSDQVWPTTQTGLAFWPDYRAHHFLWPEFLVRSWMECFWIAQEWRKTSTALGVEFGATALPRWLPAIDRWISRFDQWPKSRQGPVTSLTINAPQSGQATLIIASPQRTSQFAEEGLMRSVLAAQARTVTSAADVSSLESRWTDATARCRSFGLRIGVIESTTPASEL